VRKADNLPPSCAVVTKSGSLKFLEPSGPLQACNGTAFTISGGGSLMPCAPVFSDVYGYYGDEGIVMRIELLWDVLISGCL